MSDTDKRALVPKVLCEHCKSPMKIRASLPIENEPGLRELSYFCEHCRRTQTIRRKDTTEI
jgi:hypothetical protein